METIFFFYRKAVYFKQFKSLYKRKRFNGGGVGYGLACKQAHLCELMENFTGAKKNRARKHFFPRLAQVSLLAG